jgi:hypothetical protein
MDPLFPALPEDISAISEEELTTLLADHESAKELILNEDEKFLDGYEANEILAQLETGGNQYQLLMAEQSARQGAHEAYQAKKAEHAEKFEVKAEDEDSGDEDALDSEDSENVAEIVAEVEEVVEEKVEEPELVLASAETTTSSSADVAATVRFARRPPAPAPDREPVEAEPQGTALVAAGELSLSYPDALDRDSLAAMVLASAAHHGPMPKIDAPGRYRFGGPEHKIAKATYNFPEERTLTSNVDENTEKLREVIVAGIPGGIGRHSLTASGGLCAPAEPFYSMVNFASQAEPVWDALPVFAARRGAVNIPESTVIGDITSAISSISEANDALGGTFATKSCQDLDCPDYVETAVNIIAHCREYGNLNARSWPEKIAHENELTMAALAQTSEMFILERIKALSVNVTSGAETLGALIYLVDAIVKSMWGIRGRLRMPREARFRALLPAVVLDILVLDAVQNQFDRYKTRADVDSFLRSLGIDPVYYIDGQFAAGSDQTPDASQGAGALDAFPDTIQWALYPEGAFLGIDMGVLELGIVRDSVLNATNDFQVFGERFRNVARIAPAQACYWESSDICANGEFPPAGTARTCD